jgi:type II restriction enzyme
MSSALAYCKSHGTATFKMNDFVDLFWREAGLRRSIDKIYEIVVYALFEALVEKMCVRVRVSLDDNKIAILQEFDDFAKKVLGIDSKHPTLEMPARFHRVGVTNAADRGLDMWANYGPAVQIKHLTLDEGVAENITATVTADRIVIVCKDSEQSVILSLLSQLGWRSRIQSVITQSDLNRWYDKALRGQFSEELGKTLLKYLQNEIKAEFPSCSGEGLQDFMRERGYDKLQDDGWNLPDEQANMQFA